MLERTVTLLEHRHDLAIAYTDGLAVAPGAAPSVIRMPDWNPDRLRRQNGLAACSLYRRHVWDDVGGYNVTMPSYEDWDFWLGCLEHGLAAGHIPAPLFAYHVGQHGRHAEGLRRDLELRARIVLNHPSLFRPATVAWATALAVDGDPPAGERAPQQIDEILARDEAIRALAASRDALANGGRSRTKLGVKRFIAGRRQRAWLT